MFNSTILKLTNVCNLNCSYCYMFNLEDETHKKISKFLPVNIAVQFLDRVEDYMKKNKLKSYSIILHGGEPSLWPIKSFKVFFNKVETIRKRGYKIKLSMQTNGFVIKRELLDMCVEYKVSLGISLDGPKNVNDTYRVDFKGKGSYNKIIKNINNLISLGYGKIIGGILIVVNPLSDPIKILNWIERLPVQKVDLLWPIEYSYNNLPWVKFKRNEKSYMNQPLYGVWFFKVFEEWLKRDNPEVYIRYFNEILHYYFGGKRHTDNIVNDTLNMFVVNTDGNYEYHDYFRAFSNGKTRTRFYIEESSISDFESDELVQKFFNLSSYKPKECENCDFSGICGGGFLPGRMDDHISINKKSVLCYDHFYFYRKVNELLLSKLSLTA